MRCICSNNVVDVIRKSTGRRQHLLHPKGAKDVADMLGQEPLKIEVAALKSSVTLKLNSQKGQTIDQKHST